jgi:hypothetical protein
MIESEFHFSGFVRSVYTLINRCISKNQMPAYHGADGCNSKETHKSANY